MRSLAYQSAWVFVHRWSVAALLTTRNDVCLLNDAPLEEELLLRRQQLLDGFEVRKGTQLGGDLQTGTPLEDAVVGRDQITTWLGDHHFEDDLLRARVGDLDDRLRGDVEGSYGKR